MCPKSALQCQLTCLYVLYTVNPSPLPPRSNTNCHESSENFLSKEKQVLGKLLILINYCTLLQKRHSGVVDQWVRSWVQSYWWFFFFFWYHSFKKMLVNIIIIILFTGISKLLNIKAKKISSTCWIRTWVIFKPKCAWYTLQNLIGWHPKTCCYHHFLETMWGG